MSNIPATIEMIAPSDSEIIVKRLFKVAEILSREPATTWNEQFARENDLQNQEDQEIGYLEAKDRFIDT